MPTCKRCGRCCMLIIDGKQSTKKCRYLVGKVGGLTSCRIYSCRLGTHVYWNKDGRVNVCRDRECSPLNYPGCPYNQEKKDGKKTINEI